MAEDTTPLPGASDDERTVAQPWAPQSGAGFEPTQPIPSYPMPGQPLSATQPIPTIDATQQIPTTGQPDGASPWANPGSTQAPYGGSTQAPYGGSSQAPYGGSTQAPYAAAGQQPPWYPPPGQPYQGFSGAFYPPPPGASPYGNYYLSPPPPEKPKSRAGWGLLFVVAVVALALGVGGYLLGGTMLGASPDPQVPQQTAPVERPTQGSNTQSKSVTAAQSRGVVLIEGLTSGGTAYGTGMVLTADGKVLTNYHVVAGTSKLAVTIASTGNTYTARVLGFDQSRDVALLQLTDASGLDTVTIDRDAVSRGDQVAAVGNANGGMKLVKATGSVTGTDQALTVNSDSPWGNTEDLSGLVATNASAVPGDSGGPMFDAQDEVLGMTTAGSTKDHSSYAVPIATALAVVQQIETGQDAGTVRVGPAGFLGIEVAGSDFVGINGATVAGVTSGSPAEKAGITAGSRLTRIGDTTLTSNTNVAAVIRAIEPGQQVTIWWITSKGVTKHATVTAAASHVN